jgi:hypothetical protein
VTRSEIINTLRKYRYDKENRWAKRGFTSHNIGCLARMREWHVDLARDYGQMNRAQEARLSRALEMLEGGEAVFILHQPRLRGTVTENRKSPMGRGRAAPSGEPRWRIEYVTKPRRRPPPEDRITRGEHHRQWAQCRTCQGDRWTPVVIHGAAHYACNACCGPAQWPAMGARKADDKQILAMFESPMFEDFQLIREG